ncbi:MAG: hypothetical protein HC811_09355 [Flammeovirgaceae bacterium]|nr:hypothetical protein [Flammeovirgaceae bacterium]
MTVVTKRLIRWAGFVACVLMIPFIAMQFSDEVKWSLTDFILMGTLIFSFGVVFELIGRKSKNTLYRIAFGLGLVGAFLLFWVNGAVGIIGNEGQDANLLYVAVFAVGLIGSLISGFKPKGMSNTLYTAAVVQMLVPIIALIVWPPPAISWSPGILRVFLLNAFFASLFAASAILFRRSVNEENFIPQL